MISRESVTKDRPIRYRAMVLTSSRIKTSSGHRGFEGAFKKKLTKGNDKNPH